jgi:hypothetical protein
VDVLGGSLEALGYLLAQTGEVSLGFFVRELCAVSFTFHSSLQAFAVNPSALGFGG